jgi:ABC-type multidrug transport system ATPase subunit
VAPHASSLEEDGAASSTLGIAAEGRYRSPVVPRLEARDVRLSVGGRRILDGASFALGAREIAAIAGPSGSGKSTLLRVLSTLAEPDAGSVLLDGVDAWSIAPSVFRTRVAYVLQGSPMFEGTVADNVATGPRLRGSSLPGRAIDSALESVGLAGFGARVARELSGGEKQRVALARALANEPAALLLDEPTSALDPASARQVLSVVRSLAEAGLAVAVVTHIAEHADALGGRRLVLEEGRLRELASAQPGAPP